MTAADPPGLHLWAAPSHWRVIDFISDLHLAPDLPRTVAAWARYMRGTSADAVCMLGDVFEVWVGDDSRHQAFERGLVEVIADAAARRTVCFMPGNRDFLVGADLCAACAMTALPDPTCLLAWGRRWLLSHGDAQCLADTAYQAFRAEVRRPAWQASFLARPLAERIELARRMRRESELRRQFDGQQGTDLDADACRRMLAAARAHCLVHGHTHRPARHDLGDGLTRHVLSDWDLDSAGAARAQVLRLTSDAVLRRLSPAEACAD